MQYRMPRMGEIMSQLAIKNPILATNAAPTMSQKYGFVNSAAVLDVFKAQGWIESQTIYSKVLKADKAGFQKHMVWLKNPNLPLVHGLSKSNQTEVQLCLVNSHDGTSRMSIFLGLMRAACLNQLIGGTIFKYFHAVHSQNVVQRLPQGIDYVVQGIPELIGSIQDLQQKTLNLDQRIELASKVLPLRFENVKNLIDFDLRIVEQSLRTQDDAQDAYTVLNRLQEYLIRGGIPFSYIKHVKDLKGNIIGQQTVNTRTKKIASISRQIELNQALFNAVKVA
jgi:hypothetical protein